MVLVLAFRVVVVHSRVVITFGRKKIFSRVVPYAKHSHQYLKEGVLILKDTLIKIGVPDSAIKIGTLLPTKTHIVGGYTVSVKLSAATIKSVAKQSGKTIRSMSEAKKTILASIAASVAAGKAVAAPKKPKKPKKTTKKPTKHVLTTKQKAKLKTDGYVYITRNKKRIKIKR